MSSSPLSKTRLLTLTTSGTDLLDVSAATELLGELGFTAADLWLPETILWVEGPSDASVFEAFLASPMGRDYLGVAVRPMPAGASQFVGISAKRADAAYRFCEDAVRAIGPLKTRVRFLFDRDAKTDEIIKRLQGISNGLAEFLPVRELENLFLDAGLLDSFITERRLRFELPELPATTVASRLKELLSDHSNLAFFPDGMREGDDPMAAVKGSAILDSLSQEFLIADYRKVDDGRRLAELACLRSPGLLEPLRVVLARCLLPLGLG